MKPVLYRRSAQKTLLNMQPKRAAAIHQAVLDFSAGQGGDFKLLETGIGRIRVGNWRVLLRTDLDHWLVFAVLPRGQAYDKKSRESW